MIKKSIGLAFISLAMIIWSFYLVSTMLIALSIKLEGVYSN